MSRIEFGLRRADQKTPVELVAEVEFFCEDPETSLHCVTCKCAGASNQTFELISLRNDLGDDISEKSVLYTRAKKALENVDDLKGPYCPRHSDSGCSISMSDVLVG